MSYFNNQFMVTEGQIDSGIWTLVGMIFTHSVSAAFTKTSLASCKIAKRNCMFPIVGGLIGMAVKEHIGISDGPINIDWSMANEIVVYCSLSDGRSFKAKSTQTGYAILRSIVQQNVNLSRLAEISSRTTAAIVKGKTNQYLFSDLSFEADEAAIFYDEFLQWKTDIEFIYDTSFSEDHVNQLYRALLVIDKIGSSIDEYYRFEWTSEVTMELWASQFEINRLSPNAFFFENLAASVDVINYIIQSSEKISDKVLIKTIESAIYCS
jgi:hypothetical protein